MAETLLLADNSPTMRSMVELTCSEQGYMVVSVSDGQQAVEYLSTSRPALALIGVTLQKLGGFEVAHFVRDRPELQGVPVLLLAGAFDTIDEAQVREAGAAGVLVTPFEPALLIKRVKELLGFSRPADRPLPVRPPSQTGRLVTSTEAPDDAAAVKTAERGSHHVGKPVSTHGSDDAQQVGGPAPAHHASPAASDVEVPAHEASSLTREELTGLGEFEAREGEPGAQGESAAQGAPNVQDAPDAIDWQAVREVGQPATFAETVDIKAYGESIADPPKALGVPAADAFAVLWAHEQGEPVTPAAPVPPLQLSEESIDAVANRLADRLGTRVIDDLATRLTSSLSARLTDGLAARVTDDVVRRLGDNPAQQLGDRLADRLRSELAEQIAAQLAERVMQNAFGDSFRQTVHDVSERLVREEIARIRNAAQDSVRS